MVFQEFRSKIKKKHIIWGIVIIIFLTITIFYIVSRVVDGNFIETAFNDRFPDIIPEDEVTQTNPYKYFMSSYVDSFFIYAFSALVLLWIIRYVLKAVRKRVSPDIYNVLNVLVRIVIIPFFIIAYLNSFDAFTGALLGVAATVGVAFGIAVSKSVSDLFSGLYMVFSKHHNVGDYLIIPSMNLEGVVKEISINYLSLDQPRNNVAVIPNSKLRDHEIINISKVPVEKERDGVTDFFLYGKRVIETHFIYPLEWSSNSEDSHEICAEAIAKTIVEFKDFLEADADWRITKRDRLNRTYVINLTVLGSNKLLNLIGDFTNSLEANYELLKSKRK
ncbi:MAG: mechanosensitive ion channel [Candidatus Heimdallarchaeota archaeon]|nr:mechanosensitive ion channel [Candidatus Heimdallarchaeota archaeon]MCK4955646.1 mechanosensitive ion channel [Candidatus Heimdallarchaeota archaeon]